MRKAGVSIMDVDLRTALGAGLSVLRDMLSGMASKGRKILVNLSEVSHLDSSAIGELAWRFTRVSKQGARGSS